MVLSASGSSAAVVGMEIRSRGWLEWRFNVSGRCGREQRQPHSMASLGVPVVVAEVHAPPRTVVQDIVKDGRFSDHKVCDGRTEFGRHGSTKRV